MAATFADQSFSVSSYDAHRPKYPQELYDTIMKYHRGNKDLAVDLGCGTGIVTTELLRVCGFKKVIGVDSSEPMLDYARKSRQDLGLEFRVGQAEALDWAEAASVDMVIAGTAAHWFPSTWWDEVARVLTPQGTVAVFIYGGMWPDPHHPRAKELQAIMSSFAEELGNSSPGNTVAQNMYDDLPLPANADDFTAFERIHWNRDGTGEKLLMADQLTIPLWRKRVYTFGIAHRWRVGNPSKCGTSEDPIERIAEKIKDIASIDESTEFTCGHSLSLILLRRNQNC